MNIPAIIGLITCIISCGQSPEKNKTVPVELKPLNKSENADAEAKAESTRLHIALQEALQVANQQVAADSFSRTLEVVPDSLDVVRVKLEMANFFSGNLKHLVIKTQSNQTTCTDIYLRREAGFEKVLSHQQWQLEHIKDTIQDVNGDGIKDFLVNWYGITGCCLKNFYDVYLYLPKTGSFSRKYTFINPTFSPAEKMIRGVAYGHAGETSIYKYRWNTQGVDTLESVYYEKREHQKTGKVIIEKHLPVKSISKVSTVPKEYRTIFGYDWFTGDLDQLNK